MMDSKKTAHMPTLQKKADLEWVFFMNTAIFEPPVTTEFV